MPLMIVSVARSLLPEEGTTLITGSVVRSVVISPLVHEPSEEGGASGIETRLPADAGELGAASGVTGIGTVTIFRVLNGSFIAPLKRLAHGACRRAANCLPRGMALLDGKVAIITGAGNGIGRAHALLFAKEGASIVVNDVGGARDGTGSDASAADAVVKEIVAAGGKAVANHDSVATAAGANAIVKRAVDAFGKADILVNNAGILRDKTFLKMDEAMWDVVVAVHLKGSFLCSQAFVKQAIAQGHGARIVN